LLYSTCTLSRQENQDLVDRILEENNDLELVDLDKEFFRLTGLKNIENEKKYLEILPGFIDSEGFFYALFKKIG